MMTFHNPILTGFHPDPSICRAGDDFYLVNSTFEYFPGLPIYHSRDLVHWEHIGNALDRPSQLPLKGANDFGGLYAPTLRHWKGTFTLTCTNVSGGGNFIVTAKDPAGPWSEPVWIGVPDIDPSILFDDDGKAYYTSQGGGDKAGIKQIEIDPKTFKTIGESKVVWNDLNESWNEGPHLYKIKGVYYIMLAQGGTGSYHAEFIGRSDSPWGPFEPCPFNPILTERDDPKSPIQCTGHADLVEAPDGSWWAVFLGVRPWNKNSTSVLGRETFLAPVTWKDGWPVVGKGHHVAMEMEAPKLKPHPFPAKPAREEFLKAKLGPEWFHVRNIDPADISLVKRKGFLSLHAGKGSINSKDEVPAFAGQRQPDFKVTTRCSMDFTPGADGEEAGLMVRANDDNHYEVGVGRFDGGTCVYVRNRVKMQDYIVARRPFAGGKVFLELSAREEQYRFAWSADGRKWETLAASDAADLSKDRAGGFTGAAIGLYATANGKESANWAHFDWFEMKPGLAPETIELAPRPTPTPMPARDAWRIRAGGTGFTDSKGNAWSPDACFSGGATATTHRPMQAKEDPELYTTERWDSEFGYAFPVPPGEYLVRLRFSETFVTREGERIFDVLINGKPVLKDFDIFKEAGGFDKGIEKTFKGVVPDAQGNVRVRFAASVQNAKVCTLEVVRTKEGSPASAKDERAGKSEVLKVDDFETEKPSFGNGWWSGCDSNKLGTTIFPDPYERLPGGSPLSPGFCAGIKGHFGIGVAPWPWASLSLKFGDDRGVDLTGYQAVRFYTKGDGKPHTLSLSKAAVTDYAGFSAPFTSPKDWTRVTILFEQFTQPSWGKRVEKKFDDVNSLGFSPGANDEDYDFKIDDVEFVK